ncbi:MAG: hypothetical protein ACOZIN_18935 [Myxococcota bacterium]
MRALLLALGLFAAACGGAATCQTSCDCAQTSAGSACPGEWVCSAAKTCEYACKTACNTGAPYTCRDGEECNGSICSERTSCSR